MHLPLIVALPKASEICMNYFITYAVIIDKIHTIFD